MQLSPLHQQCTQKQQQGQEQQPELLLIEAFPHASAKKITLPSSQQLWLHEPWLRFLS
jgi:hypothetical protein